ncbi:MAG: hypothetical protein RMI34_02885, partial [Chloroherpetonaceae bacterium]|nr:hypothetical protein [Chloroherpetonaceae bacterium]MDW8019002.1 hypothetical protein [Chloroherpetonaceae bacterium]
MHTKNPYKVLGRLLLCYVLCGSAFAPLSFAALHEPALRLALSPLRKKNPSEKRYSFIRYDANQLVFPAGLSPAFQRLFAKIDSLAQHRSEKVRIVHFGGSHVQADIWTGEIRRRLREWFPDCEGERGLI